MAKKTTKKTAKKKTKRFLLIIALVFAGILTGTAAFAFFFGLGGVNLNDRVSFLLIGTDKRPEGGSYNTDSIIVASFDPQTKIVSLLSVPRDTRVTLAGSGKYYKINAIAALKGIPELEKQVTALTGITLDGYVLTNFEGFKDIIDTLGGITVDVEKNMYYETGDKEDGYIDLKAGVQKLDGAKALQYARFRHDATADIGRTARQQKVLTAIAKKMLEPLTILKLPSLVPQFMDAVETDLAAKDLLTLATAAKSFSEAQIVSQTLPGSAVNLDGLSYWEVNRAKAKEVAQNLLQGKTTDEVWDSSVLASLDADVKAHLTVPATEKTIDMPEIPGVTVPQEGAEPVRTIETEQYSGKITWSPDDNTFFAGQGYKATITLVAKAGYTLKGVGADFFTVAGATATNAAGSGIITALFPATPSASPESGTEPPETETPPAESGIPPAETEPTEAATVSMAEIAGVIPPQTGAAPATTITATTQYTGTIVWEPADNPFAPGRRYMAVITLTPAEGYTLEGVAANYFIVPGAAATNEAGSGIIKAVFAVTN